MGNTLNNKKANGLALLPFLVFIVVYMGAGLVYQSKGVDMAFYQFPSVTAMFLAVLVAFIMFKGSINEKFDTFAKGAANVDVLTMLIIYILAGAFATVAAEMGGRDATVNLGLSLVPVQFLAAGLFVIAAFMGTATGTSMGTISAITPIAVGVAEKGGLNMMVVLGAVIGGAMFGDNLSMISDTTIAATRSQHCEMRDKFRVNFLTALPAALVTIVVLLIVGRPETVTEIGDLSYSFIKVIPYLLVLILALVGMNVFLVLTIGIFAAGIVGIATGAINLAGFAQAVYNGFCGMNEVFFLTLLCGGMSELIAKNGGIEWIIQKLGKVMKGNKSAQVGIAAMVSLCDCATANNTVAIIVAGDMAREVSHEYKVDPRRTASLLDMFSCVFQGIIPYGAQLLVLPPCATLPLPTAPPSAPPTSLALCGIAGSWLLSASCPSSSPSPMASAARIPGTGSMTALSPTWPLRRPCWRRKPLRHSSNQTLDLSYSRTLTLLTENAGHWPAFSCCLQGSVFQVKRTCAKNKPDEIVRFIYLYVLICRRSDDAGKRYMQWNAE